MKVIVLQSIPQALELVKKRINEVFPLLDNIIYEREFEKTLKIIPTDEEVVVITSDMFYDNKDELFRGQEKDGSKLAQEVKKINPKARVYVFSSYEPRNEYIDGFYLKNRGGDNTGNEIIKIFMDLKLH